MSWRATQRNTSVGQEAEESGGVENYGKETLLLFPQEGTGEAG